MNYEVSEKKGDTKTVGLTELDDNHYELTIDGETVHVDAVKSGKTIYSIIEDGKQFEVIIDESGAVAKGRSKWDAPEIDGNVHVTSRRPLRAGDIVTVKIERADAYDLHGVAV